MSSTLAGGGWCGNYVRVFIRFAEVQGHPAHKLHIQSGGRSHTLAEIYYEGEWRIIDPFFNQVYFLSTGELATFRDLKNDPGIVETPSRNELDTPRLVRVYESYVPIFPALYRDAADFSLGWDDSALYHNSIVLLSYPLSLFYQGERRPIAPSWLDRPELIGIYLFSMVFVVIVAPPTIIRARRFIGGAKPVQRISSPEFERALPPID